MRARFAIAAALLVLSTPAWADNDVPKAPEVTFKETPTWVPVPATENKVMMIKAEQRPKYDIFSIDGKYYVYKKDYWFRSNTLNGPYSMVAVDSIPSAFRSIPKETWQVYPTNWGSMGTSSGPGSVYGGSSGPGMTGSASTVTGGSTSATTGTAVGGTSPSSVTTDGTTSSTTTGTMNGTTGSTTGTSTDADWTPTISFSTTPKWTTVPGSANVYYMDKTTRPTDYDLYRYNSRYYTYQRNNWYSSSSLNGPYTPVTSTDVPMAFRTVRNTYWINYPSGWTYMTPGQLNAQTKSNSGMKSGTGTTK